MLIQGAWNAVVDADPLDVSLKDLAATAGVSPSLFHRHYASRSALFAEVAAAGLATLLVNLSDEPDLEGVVSSWIRFADARPRHYALMFSPEYAEHDGVGLRRDALARSLGEFAAPHLPRAPTRAEIFTLYAMIHGAAALVASGVPRPPNQVVVQAIEGYLAGLAQSS